MSAGRLTLLLTSPRVPAGVLTRDAWTALDEADVVLGRSDDPQVEALEQVGVPVTGLLDAGPPSTARTLVTAAAGQAVVWVGSADGDPGLTDAVASEVSRLPTPPPVEVVVGSYDAPGSRLLDLVAVMDRLRSPGGCPWDAQQTHVSLVPYLLEEAHEAVEAIESGDRAHLREELGDVLLQVAFHARVGEEHPTDPFDIDDVAAGIVAKLVRRHPHVFAGGPDGELADAAGVEAVEASWETIKAAEKTASGVTPGLLDGIPDSMPSLARATKIVQRVRRSGREDALEAALPQGGETPVESAGRELLALVARWQQQGVDPEAALRGALREVAARL